MTPAVLAAVVGLALSPAADPDAGKKEQARRDALWAALLKALPKGVEAVDAYAENPSLTEVCFSSGGRVYSFSLADKKVDELVFMKLLPKINRIEFAVEPPPPTVPGGQGWAHYKLWSNGRLEMSCSATK